MEVFRISQAIYADKLTASGSANRWNTAGQNVIYTGASRSLSTLESIVHRASVKPSAEYKIMVISITDDDRLIRQIQLKELPPDWRTFAAYPALQTIGSDWYKMQETLVLKVPLAVIVNEHNYVINTEHVDFKKNIKLVRTEDYFWDTRLL